MLTNYLKEIVSYRQWNMTEETYLMAIIKEKLCYCSLNFMKDLESTKNRMNKEIYREYVLPDYVTNETGYIKGEENLPTQQTQTMNDNSSVEQQAAPQRPPQHQQILKMNSERISVPEILFNPSDIGNLRSTIVLFLK